MNRIKNKIGGSYISVCVYIIAITMILSAVLFDAKAMTVISTTKENMQMILDSFIMKNSVEIYDSIKQGHDFTTSFDEKFCFDEYSRRFSLDFSENELYNVNEDGEIVYSLTKPQVVFKMKNSLKLTVYYTIRLPVKFAGKTLYQMEIPLSVSSGLTLKNQ